MTASKLALLLLLLISFAASAQNVEPSALQKKLVGHWVTAKDAKLHSYFSLQRRYVDRDIPSDDATFTMNDYQVFDEWPDLHTIIIEVNENTIFDVMLVITFSDDGKSATCREKTTKGWTDAYRLVRVDDKTHPSKMPERIKITDLEHALGSGQ